MIKHFTHEEIKALITFFESPIGQKYTKTLPGVNQQTYEVGKSFGKDVRNQIMQQLRLDGYLK